MQWISVKDRLPEMSFINEENKVSKEVLCVDSIGYFVARWSEKEGKEYNFWNPTGRHLISLRQNVTHWMPLPEKPKD